MGEKPLWEQIGSSFVQQYYRVFDTDRSQLGAIYTDASCLTWEGLQYQGKSAIIEKLTALPFQKIMHSITAEDHQPTTDSCILSMVVGQLKRLDATFDTFASEMLSHLPAVNLQSYVYPAALGEPSFTTFPLSHICLDRVEDGLGQRKKNHPPNLDKYVVFPVGPATRYGCSGSVFQGQLAIAASYNAEYEVDEDPVMGFHQVFLLKNCNDAWICTNDMFRLSLHNFG